jgi:hypothetical protein
VTRSRQAACLAAGSAVLAIAGTAFPPSAAAYVDVPGHAAARGVLTTDDGGSARLAGSVSSTASSFHAVTPFPAYRSGGRLAAGRSRTVTLAGVHGLPGGLTAVALVVTVSHATAATSVAAFPAGGSHTTAAVSVAKGLTATGATIVPTDRQGRVTVRNAAGRAHVAVTVTGYLAAGSGGDSFHPLVTAPVLAPREVAAGKTAQLPVVGARSTGLPPDGSVAAVALDVRAVAAGRAVSVSAYPTGQGSSRSQRVLDAARHESTSGLAVVPVGPAGRITLRTAHGPARLSAAVEGYWTAAATGGQFHPVSPVATSTARLHAGRPAKLSVAGVGDVPTSARDGAVLLGVTAGRLGVTAGGAYHATQVAVAPRGSVAAGQLDLPASGAAATTAVAVPIAHDKDVSFTVARGTAKVTVSVLGWFAPAASGHDLSAPQCSQPLPTDGAFGVVAATAGLPYTPASTTCFDQELAWAKARAAPPSYYLNLVDRGQASPYWPSGATEPRPCASSAPDWDDSCAYDYGYRAAEQAVGFATANGAAPGRWWVDVEIGGGEYWGSATPDAPGHLDANAADIRGTLDYLKSRHLPIGVYSTTQQWQEITGAPAGFADAATWGAGSPTAADARSHCIATSFTGGPALLEQVVDTAVDYSC